MEKRTQAQKLFDQTSGMQKDTLRELLVEHYTSYTRIADDIERFTFQDGSSIDIRRVAE